MGAYGSGESRMRVAFTYTASAPHLDTLSKGETRVGKDRARTQESPSHTPKHCSRPPLRQLQCTHPSRAQQRRRLSGIQGATEYAEATSSQRISGTMHLLGAAKPHHGSEGKVHR